MWESPEAVAIVDDDASLCRSLARLLRLDGYEASVFRSAEEFLRDPDPGRFACALLDIQLGGMSGLELQRAMTARGDLTAIIFVSAHDEPAVRAEAMQGGCAAFFSKTESGEHILDAIRKATSTSLQQDKRGTS